MTSKRAVILQFVLALLVIFGLRLPYCNWPVINWDESLFIIVAEDLAAGGTPYLTAWEPKGPFLFFILAAAIKVVGNSICGVRIFTTLYLLGSMLLVFFLSSPTS